MAVNPYDGRHVQAHDNIKGGGINVPHIQTGPGKPTTPAEFAAPHWVEALKLQGNDFSRDATQGQATQHQATQHQATQTQATVFRG